MSGFKVNFSVNNQLSTPSIHAAPFAQRPAAGQPGRVFIDSDNPSTGIYRDTGTTWVVIGMPSSPEADTLQIVTNRGNTTTNSITVGATTSPAGTIDVRRTTAALNGANDWAIVSVNSPTIPSGASFGVNYVNAVYGSQALTFSGNATIGNTGINAAGNFINSLGNNASGTITVAQGSGTIRAIAGLHAGIYYNTPNAMTFTHVAGIKTLQPINSGAVGASVTNYYGVQIGDSTPSSGTISYTNRWGIYQEGASDRNYFAGNVGVRQVNPYSALANTATQILDGGIGTSSLGIQWTLSDGGYAIAFENTGSSAFSNVLLLKSGGGGSIINAQSGNTTRLIVFSSGNTVIGGGTDAGYRLDVQGTFRATGDGRFDGSDSRTLTIAGTTYQKATLIRPGSVLCSDGSVFSTYVTLESLGNTGRMNFAQTFDFRSGSTYSYNTLLSLDAAGTFTFNAGKSDINYFFKTDNSDNTLYIDGGNDNVGIGTATPNASALFDITSTTKGFLPPRMTDAQITAITTPAAGLMVYSTDQNCPAFYDGTGWRKISHSPL